MKLAITFGPQCLTFKGHIDFSALYQDPRGLTGSEFGVVRVAEEMVKLGHDVTLYTVFQGAEEWRGVKLRPLDKVAEIDDSFDAAISWSEPDTLRPVTAKRKVLYQMLNGWTYCQPGFDACFDVGVAVSNEQRRMILEEWHGVGSDPNGGHLATVSFAPEKWKVVPLGCDPEKFPNVGDERQVDTGALDTLVVERHRKQRGKVIYCSSPDRGLHLLLQEWPAIKEAVPHAELHVYYRLSDFVKGFYDASGMPTPYFPPIEENRSRALYIAECIRRFADAGGMGVHIHDSVSRDEIEREMASAEVLAYPCQTLAWSEGFSCTILECCAARACPITTDCDALGDVYGEALPLVSVAEEGWVEKWRERVVMALTDEAWRAEVNENARAFAETRTWKMTAEKLLEICHGEESKEANGDGGEKAKGRKVRKRGGKEADRR